MPYRLRNGLSFCHVDGGIIFLDVPGDRYFQLPKPLEHEFTSLLCEDARLPPSSDALRRANIIVSVDDDSATPRAHPVNYPSCSALEDPFPSRLSFSVIFEVLWIVSRIHHAIRPGRLNAAVDAMCHMRDRHHSQAAHPPLESADPLAVALASQFHRARPFVPIETCCLLDSIAMIHFLARQRVFARLVFGVTGNPFSAHCWVQHGDMVLNDTVGHVMSHMPIWEA